MKCLLVDIGTSSVRAVVASDDGTWLATASRRHHPTVDDEGASTFDPVRLVGRTRDVMRQALQAAAVPVDVVAMACFAPSLMGVDHRGQPTTPLFLYADRRPAPDAARLRRRLDLAAVHERTGAPIHASYWPAKLAWLGRTMPEVAASSRWLDLGGFAYGRLVGQPATSPSLISWTGLHDPRAGEWDRELLATVGVREDGLPAPADDDAVIGGMRGHGGATSALSPFLAGASWLPPVADGYASTIGLIGPDSHSFAVNLGTTFAVRALMSEPPRDLPLSLFRHALGGGAHVVGGALAEGGGTISWLRRTFGPSSTSAVLAQAGPMRAPSELVVVPTLDGERSPGWNERSRGSVSGIDSTTTRREIVEAWTEAIVVRLAAAERDLEAVAGPPESIVVAGKATRSPFVVSQLERLTQRQVVVGEEEATLRGLLHLVQRAAGTGLRSS